MPEFSRYVIEALRQPLENGVITIARSSDVLTFPAKCILVAAMNPCHCGNYGDSKLECICSPIAIENYRKKISGPLLDRIDIQVSVPRETYKSLHPDQESSTFFRDRAVKARQIQNQRFKNTYIITNSELNSKQISQYCKTTPDANSLLEKSINAKNLSFRAAHKILKIARTIADIDSSDIINSNHIAEAMGYRTSIYDP